MDWYFSAPALLWLLAYIALTLGMDYIFYDFYPKGRKPRLAYWMVVVGVSATVLNAVTYFGSYGIYNEPYMDAKKFAASQGLRPGTAYPVKIGERVSGSNGSGYVYGGIFTSAGRIDIQPGSSISMGFRSGDSSYIFEIPMNKVTFKEAEGLDSSVTFYLQSDVGEYGDSTSRNGRCQAAIESVILVQRCEKILTYHPYSDALRRGLAPVITDALDSATIRLSPELYRSILGQP